MFSTFDWSQAMLYGTLGGGAVLVLLALVHFCRAMFANREDAKNYEDQQPVYLASLGLGAVMLIGGICFRNYAGSSTNSNSSDLSSYTQYVSKEGRFKASFPAEPKEQSQSALGMKIKMMAVEEKDGTFAVAYLDIPGGAKLTGRQMEDGFKGARTAMLQSMNAKLLKEDRISLNGKYPGREIHAEVPGKGGEMYCSIYFVEGRVYQVLVAGKTAWLNSDKARKFLNSFALR